MCVGEYFDKISYAFPCLAGSISYVSSCITGKFTQWKQKMLSLNQKAGTTACQMSKISEGRGFFLVRAIQAYKARQAHLISALDRFENSAMGRICTCNLNIRVNQKNCSSVCLIAGTIKIIRERGVRRAVHNSFFHPSKPFEKCSPSRTF